ncbi:hypothetical protein NUW54_g12444 [Trametes sanguinea]|uniref:Uncharacterized protein n=1 Tax=Trametes sanguinea TaxID=158606 RepID=A0ACC1MZL8_9APHY|nr:hypothetical protein NUW54_g12444 [Trametes sanguinea]
MDSSPRGSRKGDSKASIEIAPVGLGYDDALSVLASNDSPRLPCCSPRDRVHISRSSSRANINPGADVHAQGGRARDDVRLCIRVRLSGVRIPAHELVQLVLLVKLQRHARLQRRTRVRARARRLPLPCPATHGAPAQARGGCAQGPRTCRR